MICWNTGTCPNKNGADDKNKKSLRLSFLRSQLLYDIENIAYASGHALPDEAQHVRHLIQDIGQKGNVDRVDRILSLVHAACVEMLYPYTQSSVEDDRHLNDRATSPKEYAIVMRVPEDFSVTTARLLETLIHEYMVYRVLADWLMICGSQASGYWLQLAEQIKGQIEEIKHRTSGRIRRPCKPF